MFSLHRRGKYREISHFIMTKSVTLPYICYIMDEHWTFSECIRCFTNCFISSSCQREMPKEPYCEKNVSTHHKYSQTKRRPPIFSHSFNAFLTHCTLVPFWPVRKKSLCQQMTSVLSEKIGQI